eukprot:TRINITY_DN6335_c0_g2_i2.p1 TRINITY_DN6335_c0_g2~~TRINITY_DN6335_c0_g2_i2.p1  ORF type:complete len:250 (-),score=65.85 TRINITY_DN6335_c0_g2_i2:254-1003(-)
MTRLSLIFFFCVFFTSGVLVSLATAAANSGATAASTSSSSTATSTSTSNLLTIDGIIKPANISLTKTRVTLTGVDDKLIAIPRVGGKFIFHEVPVGSYLLEVLSTEYEYPPLRVDVSTKFTGKLRARHLLNPSNHAAVPLVLTPERSVRYFEVREPFNVLGLLKNPMFLMLGFTLVMLVILPKMMSSLGNEAVEELQNSPLNQAGGLLQTLMPNAPIITPGALAAAAANNNSSNNSKAAAGGGRKPKRA